MGQWVLWIQYVLDSCVITVTILTTIICHISQSPVYCFADQWELDPDELALGQQIGSGQFGLVQEGRWKKTKVAVKKIREGCMSEDELREEARVMM